MNSSKRLADDMSGADDTDMMGSSNIRRRIEEPIAEDDLAESIGTPTDAASSQTMSESETTTKIKEFSELRLSSLPVNLMTAEFKNYLFYKSNERLEQAKEDGARLADITVGDDCLPSWPTRTWDPTRESLHHVIQTHLVSREEAQRAGKLGAAADEAIEILFGEGDEQAHEDHTMASRESSVTYAQDGEPGDSLGQAAGNGSMDASTAICTVSTDSSDSDTSSDADMDYEEAFDDEITGRNIFDDQAYYYDPDDDEPNIFHGAQVMGVASYVSIVDLEVYTVEDDDDEVADLPEMELSIDREAFESLFGTDEAIDVEIEGRQLYCTGELFAVGGEEDHVREQQTEAHYLAASLENTGDVEMAQGEDVADAETEEQRDGPLDTQNNATGAQVLQDNTARDIFREVEDGFIW
ncbi:hypothetical protein F66182_9376 [Fusarium sp. NRRL 66182]|nr:hypothetical protein F66182_9376 [Fusarium sp. NRRL 66182]